MATHLRKIVRAIPPIRRSYRVLKSIYRLPEQNIDTDRKLDNLTHKQKLSESSINAISSRLSDVGGTLANLNTNIDLLREQLMALEKGGTRLKISAKEKLFAENHLLDVFYTHFEDKFRGDEISIKKRLMEYVGVFKNAGIDYAKYPVIDIGCGRGEFLEIMKQNNIKAIGLDINTDMVDRAKEKGLKVELGSALDYFNIHKDKKFGAVTGFHIVEHIPFEDLLILFAEVHKSLVKGGFVIFETPNPENLVTGSIGFYMDPSHLHPLPPQLLEYALETCGFYNIEIRRLHPANIPKDATAMPQDILNRLYGPLDYAAIAYK